jgi:anti-sigma28 factor (negative regulator of flagellin synthesis)
MEEAIVDVALDLNLLPAEEHLQPEAQEDMLTDNRDQAQHLAHVQESSQASCRWPQDRAARVETLRLSIANGAYHVDSAELAECIVRNSTRFVETSLALAETH